MMKYVIQMTGTAPRPLDLQIEKPEDLIRERVVRAVREAISAGVLAPGRRLTEAELTELTGVSRTSVREALRQLQAVGLVERAPKRGLRVAVLRSADIEHIYEVRGALEPLATELFVKRASDLQVRELVELFQPVIQPGTELEAGLNGSYRFIEALLDGAGNPVLSSMLLPLNDRIHALRRVSLSRPGRWQQSRREHQDIIGAIEARDARRAAAASRRHIAAATDAALAAVKTIEPQLS
jgi:DNA-binding GntR family transcriptional regulator